MFPTFLESPKMPVSFPHFIGHTHGVLSLKQKQTNNQKKPFECIFKYQGHQERNLKGRKGDIVISGKAHGPGLSS